MHQREVFNIQECEPDSFNISLRKILTFRLDEQDWSDRLVIMGVDALLLEDEKGLWLPLVKFGVRELKRLFLWLSIGTDNEYFLVEFINTGSVHHENALVQEEHWRKYISLIIQFLHLLTMSFGLSFHDRRFEPWQDLLYRTVCKGSFSFGMINLDVFTDRIYEGNYILNAFLDDELVSEPWLHLGNQLIDSL
jgi:hypothetical protein